MNQLLARLVGRPDAIWLGLGLYTCVWTLSHVISDANLDPYGDMLENFAWSQVFTWGTGKHPPLIAWVTGAWFTLFPRSDAAYHLLAYLNGALGLLGVYRLVGALGYRYLALPSVLLLSLALPYSTLTIKFNANTVLLALWPWVAWCWVLALQATGRRVLVMGLALGLLAGLALLGKYYSGVLLLGIGMAALATREGRAWLFSWRPVLPLMLGTLVLAPHIQWLFANDFVSFDYVLAQGGTGTDWGQVVKFAAAPFSYWLLPWLVVTWITTQGEGIGTRLKQWPLHMVRAWRPRNDLLTWLALTPWIVSVLIGASGFVALSMPWAIPIGYLFLPYWLRNLPSGHVDLRAARAFCIWLGLVLVLSPVYAWQQATSGNENFYRPRSEAAAWLLQRWDQDYPDLTPGWVGGEWPENGLVAFYGNPMIRTVRGMPDRFPATLLPHPGWATQPGLLLCPLGPADKPRAEGCAAEVEAWLGERMATMPGWEFEVSKPGFRHPLDRPFRYRAYVYLPPDVCCKQE